MKVLFSSLLIFFCVSNIFSQRNYRNNNNAWIVYSGDHKVSSHWGVHLEFQERRSDYLESNQQRLIRLAINYHALPQAFISLGYAFVNTYPYGIFPTQLSFPEQRIYQQLQLSNVFGRIESQSRFRLEQRWLKLPIRIDSISSRLDENKYFGRFRMAQRFSLPLYGEKIVDKSIYATITEELFVNYGKNVGNNIFDQNRLLLGIGYKVPKAGRVELGYLFHRLFRSDGIRVENNHTIQLALYSNFEFIMKNKN